MVSWHWSKSNFHPSSALWKVIVDIMFHRAHTFSTFIYIFYFLCAFGRAIVQSINLSFFRANVCLVWRFELRAWSFLFDAFSVIHQFILNTKQFRMYNADAHHISMVLCCAVLCQMAMEMVGDGGGVTYKRKWLKWMRSISHKAHTMQFLFLCMCSGFGVRAIRGCVGRFLVN